MALVNNPDDLRLGMVGMVEGNGHPYSWSAIINGRYDPIAMSECGYPVIPRYLSAAPEGEMGIPCAKVTHVWCDDPADSEKVAKAACIPNIATTPETLIGQVDAVIIPTDRGHEHLERARPFVDAGVPVFIDKPLTDREDHLEQFASWYSQGKAILSTSCMRYAREFEQAREQMHEIGELRFVTMTTSKSWERYGIHALEGVYPFLAPGEWESVVNTGTYEGNFVHCRHGSGVDVVLAAVADMYGAFGCLGLYGTKGRAVARFEDTFFAFKAQLAAFVEYLRTGELPFAFTQTVELMKIIIAGIRSREEGGRRVSLQEIRP